MLCVRVWKFEGGGKHAVVDAYFCATAVRLTLVFDVYTRQLNVESDEPSNPLKQEIQSLPVLSKSLRFS